MKQVTTSLTILDRIREQVLSYPQLAEAIQSIDLEYCVHSGYQLILRSRSDQVNYVNEKLLWISRLVLAIAPIAILDVDGDRLSMAGLQRIAASINRPLEGVKDKALRMQIVQQKSLLLDCAIDALSENYSVFLITLDGRYEDVRFHKGTTSLIEAEVMIGKHLAEVIGKDPAEVVLECLKAARIQRQQLSCYYDIQFKSGERRWYEGKAFPPKPDQRIQLFLVKRLK